MVKAQRLKGLLALALKVVAQEWANSVRAHFLRSQHVATLRVPAKRVLEDLEAVVTRIVDVCLERVGKLQQRRENSPVPLHHPADGSPPLAGEEL